MMILDHITRSVNTNRNVHNHHFVEIRTHTQVRHDFNINTPKACVLHEKEEGKDCSQTTTTLKEAVLFLCQMKKT